MRVTHADQICLVAFQQTVHIFFSLLIFGIIAVSLLPMVIGMVKARRSASKATSEGA